MANQPKGSIVGLGVTPMGKIYGRRAVDFAAEPLRLLDCCLVSNGAVAVIVTSPERARDLKQPPVHVLGYATCAPGDNLNTARHPAVETGAKRSGEMAFRMAGITREDIGTCQLYDCYTYTRSGKP